MAIFKGTIQEFHHYLGPRIRNLINTATKKIRSQRNGICEICNEIKELQSAHIVGLGRRSIIERVIDKNKIGDLIECNIRDIEREIVDAHLPFENSFKFLCHACHRVYDRDHERPKSVRQPKIKLAKENDEEFTKLHRIKNVAKKPHQYNHKIISAYLSLETNGAASLKELKSLCSDNALHPKYFVKTFDTNYAQMKTDAGNSHGKIFYENGQLVKVWPRVRAEIERYFPSDRKK